MKNLLFLLLLFLSLSVFSQKKIKPNVNKAEKMLREGQLDVAKKIIDITVASDKFLFDPKAWYVYGVIYTSLDTTNNEIYKSLTDNSFNKAIEAFDKYKKFDSGKKPIFITNASGMPIIPEQSNVSFAQYYFDKALTLYQDEKEYQGAIDTIEKTLFFIPNDSSVLLNAGLFFAPSAKEYDKSIDYLERYLDMGGKSKDAYTMMFGIYRDEIKDNEKALEVAQKGEEAFPDATSFLEYQIDIYVRSNRLEEAKELVKRKVEQNPDNAKTHYHLGLLSQDLNQKEEAIEYHRKSIELDSDYLEPRIALAELIHEDAKKIKAKMNELGITATARKKRFELDKQLVEQLRIVMPYWEACEEIDGANPKVLDNLYSIYKDLGLDDEAKRVANKY